MTALAGMAAGCAGLRSRFSFLRLFLLAVLAAAALLAAPNAGLAVPPIANDSSATVAFNSTDNPITLNITGGAPDSVQVVGAAIHGTMIVNGASVTYTPLPGYAGPDSFTYTASNADGTSAPATVSITVSPPPITISPASLPAGTQNVAYSQTLTASGGTAPYTFAVTAGALPAGMTLSSGGALSGTPTVNGTFNFTVTATDSSGGSGPFSGSQPYSLTINAPNPPIANNVSATVAFNSTDNPITLNITGGAPTSVAVPTGPTNGSVSISGTSITYTPTAGYAGPDSFTYTATNADGTSAPATVSITVGPPTITISPASLPDGTLNVAYSQTLTASGGTAPYTFAVTLGTLPTGMTLSSGGALSGTPTAGGIFNFTVTATDSSTGPAAPFSGSQAYSLTINAPNPPIANDSSATVAANSTDNPITLNITGGAPTSVAVASPASQGTATAAGTSITYTPTTGYFGPDSFTYTATNADGTSAPATVSITVTPLPPPIANNVSSTVAFNSTNNPITLNITGGAPTSVAVTTAPANGSVGVSGTSITYTPTAGYAGPDSFTYTASNAFGTSAPATVSITVGAPTITVNPAVLPAGTQGTAYSQTLTAIGGTAPYTFTITAGALPAGVSLNSGGILSGTPTANGTFNFTATATDSSTGPAAPFSGSQAYSLTISVGANPPVANNVSATVAPNSANNPITLNITGGAPTSVAVAAAPAHGSVSVSGTSITYTPAAGYAGPDSFAYTATNADGTSAAATASITVSAPTVTVSPASLPAGTQGTAYSRTLTASGGTAPYTFTITAGALPAGMALSPAGVLSGTPTASGTFNFAATATDSSSGIGPFTGNRAYSLVIGAGDHKAPVFVTFPGNIAKKVDYPATSATAAWATPTATDNLPGVIVSQIAGPASGSSFPIGKTTITYEAVDTAGNSTVKSFTVTVTQTSPGQVTVVVNSAADGEFGFTSPEPLLNFAISTQSGTGTSGPITIRAGKYGFAFTVPSGLGVAAASCSDPASTIDPAVHEGKLTIASGAKVTCTISAVDSKKTIALIGQFLETRADLILSNAPDVDRRIERLTGNYTSNGGVSGFGLGFTSQKLPFSLRFGEKEASFSYSLRRSHAEAEAAIDTRVATAHGARPPSMGGMTGGDLPDDGASLASPYAADTRPTDLTAPFNGFDGNGVTVGGDDAGQGTDPMLQRFDIWTEGKIVAFDSAGGDGHFAIVHGGVDYLFTPSLLAGIGVQIDWTSETGAGDSEIEGTGYLVGPYLTARLSDRLYFDVRAAWGQSFNTVSPYGTYSDDMNTTRWLVSGALIGKFDIERWSIQPEARLSYYDEETDAYTDSLGVLIPSLASKTGTFEFGPTVSYDMMLEDGTLLRPYATFEGIWTFEQDNTAGVITGAPGLNETGLRGRSELGFTVSRPSGAVLSTSAFYDGIGDSDYSSWGGGLRMSYSF